MKMRLSQPGTLVDLSGIAELRGIRREGDNVVIGAMTRHAEVAASKDVKAAIPALAALAEGIGDRQVRNMGTLGGALANNDPAACYPAAVLGLGRHRPHEQAQDRRGRLLQGHVRDGAGRRRDSSRR